MQGVMRTCTLALAIAALGGGSARGAAHKRFIDVKVSPKGTYVGALSEENGKRTLTFFNLATHQGTFALKPDGESTIGRFLWANDDRAVIEMVDLDGTLTAAPVTRGEIYAVDAKGTAGKVIFGYRAGQSQAGSHIKRVESEWAWGFVISRLRNDPRHVLIAQYSFQDTGDRFADIYSLDVYSGLKTKLTRSPLPMDWVTFISDETGALRIAAGYDEEMNRKFFWLGDDAHWSELTTLRGVSAKSEPLGFASSDKLLYVSEPAPGGFGVYAISIETGARKPLTQSELVPESATVEDTAGHIVAVEYEPDLPTYDFVQKDHPLSRTLDGLLAARPNEHVHLVNATDDGRKALVKVYSDRNPGEFLVVDTASLSAVPVAQAEAWV